MINTGYRWVIVAAGGLLGCLAIGAMFSLPVFLLPISRDTGWSVTGVSSAMTIGFLAMAFASIFWGGLSDRWGPRPIVFAGSVLLAVSLMLASWTTSLIGFQLVFGLLVGVAAAAIFAPMMACVTGWFDTHRSLAVSLVSAGMGMAPMTMSPFAAWLVSGHDWRTSMQIIAILVAVVMIPVSLLVRRAPALEANAPAAAKSVNTPAEPSMSLGEVLKSPQFIILLLTNFFCCATHSGPIFHTVSYAITCGIPMIAAVSIYSIEGLAGMGGRVVFGLLGDRFGAKHILVLGLLAQAFGALAYVFAGGLGSFYAVAGLFGFIYAGVMPLYAVIARENFPLKMMGTVIGGTAMAGSLGMATGPLAGGLIYDTFASYTWLYVGSWGIGLGAFLIALTFKPIPKSRMAVAAAA
ncbi:MFS family permease [Pararhizobium capsulatum DSM 1112]|uniref:MFS family permease n=1 Tax=Pararhizobium capsulatum DSM 1112 TaxID=1121113 RepID=A0ABU0BWM4_9HYPH|nr:MFS transporter [Pararhizobium capsulatum]MDQ0322663.1 MFS family permease [Pararhizobium capsulatum DSM 1112]